MWLHRIDILRQERFLNRGDQTGVRQVDAFDLDLRRFLVQQVAEFLLTVLRDWFVRVEVSAPAVDAPVPAIHAVTGNRQSAVVERLAVVVQR